MLKSKTKNIDSKDWYKKLSRYKSVTNDYQLIKYSQYGATINNELNNFKSLIDDLMYFMSEYKKDNAKSETLKSMTSLRLKELKTCLCKFKVGEKLKYEDLEAQDYYTISWICPKT